MWMLKNSKGEPDAMLTFSIIAFSVVMVKIAFNELTFLGIDFGKIDAGLVASVLTPTLGAYVLRRGQDNKLEAAKPSQP